MRSICFWLISVSILLFSCGDANLRFTEAQPQNAEVLSEFPKSLRSELEILSDSTFVGYFDLEYPIETDGGMNLNAENTIVISKNAIYNHLYGTIVLDFTEVKDSIKKAQYDQEFLLDSIILDHFNRPKYSYELVSLFDSVFVYDFSLTDTMFLCSSSNVLKKFNDDFYLSILRGEDSWSVYKISCPINSELVWFCSISENDETILRRIMKVNIEDFENAVLSPSQASMTQFHDMKGFERIIELQRKPG